MPNIAVVLRGNVDAWSVGLYKDGRGKMRIRKTVLPFMVLCVIVAMSACGSWQKTGAITYSSMQIAHEQMGRTVNRMYAEGTITQEDYEKIEIDYDKAAVALYQAGDVWSDIIDSGSLSRQKEYEALLITVERLMNNIDKIVRLYGERYSI